MFVRNQKYLNSLQDSLSSIESYHQPHRFFRLRTSVFPPLYLDSSIPEWFCAVCRHLLPDGKVTKHLQVRISRLLFQNLKAAHKFHLFCRKHLIPNLERKCRLCLSDKEIVQSIFQSDNSKETTDTLVEKIFECTAIMVGVATTPTT